MFDSYLSESSVKLFEKTGVLSKPELEARNEVKWEIYTKKIQIEARVLGDLALNHIIPVATRYQSMPTTKISRTPIYPMIEQLKHECGIALVRLRKPLEYYQRNTEARPMPSTACIC